VYHHRGVAGPWDRPSLSRRLSNPAGRLVTQFRSSQPSPASGSPCMPADSSRPSTHPHTYHLPAPSPPPCVTERGRGGFIADGVGAGRFGVSHWRQSISLPCPRVPTSQTHTTVVLFRSSSSMTQRQFRAAPGLFSMHLVVPACRHAGSRWLPLSPGSLRRSSSRGMPACLRVDNPHRLFVKKTPNCRGNSQLTTGAVTAWACIRLPWWCTTAGSPASESPPQCWMRWHPCMCWMSWTCGCDIRHISICTLTCGAAE